MEPFDFICTTPGCGISYRCRPDLVGKTIQCKSCGKKQRITAPTKPSEPGREQPNRPTVPIAASRPAPPRTSSAAARAVTQPTERPIPQSVRRINSPTVPARPARATAPQEVHCPNCRQTCRVLAEWRGTSLRCPHCQKLFVVPAAAPLVSDDGFFVADESPVSTAVPEFIAEPVRAVPVARPVAEAANYGLSNLDDSDFQPVEEAVTLPAAPEPKAESWLDRMFKPGPKKKKRKKPRREREEFDGPGGFGKFCCVVVIVLFGIRLLSAVLLTMRFGVDPWTIIGGAVAIVGIPVVIGYMNGSVSPTTANILILVLAVGCGTSNLQNAHFFSSNAPQNPGGVRTAPGLPNAPPGGFPQPGVR